MKRYCLYITLLIIVLSACQSTIQDHQKENSDKSEVSGSLLIEGTELIYFARGNGEPFLVVGSSPDYFSNELKKHFQLFFIDTRGTAEKYSPIDTSHYSVETLLSDIDTLRAVLGLNKFIVGGHSIMGAISLEYARRYPDYVSHVVMIGTPRIYGTAEFNAALNKYWEAAPKDRKLLFEKKQKEFGENSKDLSPTESFVKSIVASSPKRWHDANFDATEFLSKVHFNLDFVSHLFGNMFREFDLCQSDNKFTKPVWMATGKSDYVSPPTLWEGECESLPKLSISFFEESGHTPHYEQSELFNQRLIDWVKKN